MRSKLLILLSTGLLTFCGPDLQQQPEKEELPSTATVMTDGLNVRISPNLYATEVGRLNLDEEVSLLKKSVDKMKVGSMESHWYRVKTAAGLKGWVYGAYLSVEASEDALRRQSEKTREKIMQMITGRWYATTDTGGILNFYISLMNEGEYEFGYGRKVNQQGKWEADIRGNKAEIRLLEIEKPVVRNIQAELRGATLILEGEYRNKIYKFKLTEKNPTSFKNKK